VHHVEITNPNPRMLTNFPCFVGRHV
jgi:hypothetical protein